MERFNTHSIIRSKKMAQNVIINGVTYQSVPEVDIPKSGGGTAKFYDTASANIVAADIPTGKTAFGSSGSVSGSMPVNGDVSGTISTKSGTVVVPSGQTTGGTISLASSAIADLVASNILRNKTILGIEGALDMVSVSQDSTTKVLSIS
jgi:hypothetical protein